ncbi:MAG: hypothetical protein P8179_22310, partial [Candidatus Thiodiazotropha sp.]
MSNFIFMAEWPELQEPAGEAESLLQADLRAACFYARFAMERAVHWVYRCELGMVKSSYDHTPSTPFGIRIRCDLVINRRAYCVAICALAGWSRYGIANMITAVVYNRPRCIGWLIVKGLIRMITARHIRLLALALTTFFIAPNAWSGACGTQTSSSVTAIPFDFYVVKNKGRWITLSATSNDIEWNNLNEGWPTRYKAFKYGGGSAIREWKLDSLPTHGDLYEGTTKLSAGSTISDPDELYFVPELNFTGNDAFGYCVTDSSGRSSVAEVKLNTSNAASYPMPLGMPRPDFGINEEPPEDPVEWPSSEATGFYYIDSDASNCSDANTYGWPDQPRCTIETNATIEAGRKMVLARSALPYQLRSGLTWDQIYLNGTADNPAWLVGEDRLPDKPKITLGPGLSRQELRLQGTGNYRITGIDFDGANPNNRGVGDNVVIRYSRVQNFPSTGGGGTSVGLSSGDGPGTNVLAFHVNANDNGIVSSTLEEERDIHAFVGSNQHNFWMVDIMCSENAGDCVQLTNGNTTENVYVGRAIMHSMMENCTDFKDFHNFVVTESSCWDIRNVAYTSGSGGNAQNFYVNDEGVQQGYGYILNNR